MAKAATRAEFPFIIWKENLKEASSEQLFSPVSRSSRLPNPPRKTKAYHLALTHFKDALLS